MEEQVLSKPRAVVFSPQHVVGGGLVQADDC